jgi:hypothetical protein
MAIEVYKIWHKESPSYLCDNGLRQWLVWCYCSGVIEAVLSLSEHVPGSLYEGLSLCQIL